LRSFPALGWLFSIIFALLALLPQSAWAQADSALLSVRSSGNIGEAAEQRFIGILETGLGTAWGLERSRAALQEAAPDSVGCFTPGCLLTAAEILSCEVAYVAEIKEEFETYEAAVKVFALTDGSFLTEYRSSCELCTLDEAELALAALATEATRGWVLPAPAEPVAMVSPDAEARLWVMVQPDDATIFVDDRALGVGSYNGMQPSGRRRVRVEREQYQSVEQTVDVGDGASRVYVSLQSEQGGASEGLLDELNREPWAWATTVTGVLLMGGGITLLALDGQATCSGDVTLCPNVLDTAAGGATALAIGAASVMVGVTLFAWESLAGESSVALLGQSNGMALRTQW
jgi:hypothetical protein